MSVIHAAFHIERTFDAAPQRVFRAFADPLRKKAWSCHENWESLAMAFEVGGREVTRGGPLGGPVYAFDGVYLDIVEGARFVIAYTMERDGVRISVSLLTVQFAADGTRTRLTITEQGAFLDGHEDPSLREQGSGEGLDHLAQFLKTEGDTQP